MTAEERKLRLPPLDAWLSGAVSGDYDFLPVGPSALDCIEAAIRADPELTIEEAICVVPVSEESIRLSREGRRWRRSGGTA